LGLSTCDLEVAPSGRVDARFVFASAEPLRGVLLDRDGDGIVTDAEVDAARDALAAFVARGVDVSADEERCPATFGGATLRDVDGLAVNASFACPEGAEHVTATLYYLSELGRDHREVARITAGDVTVEAVLSRDRREISVRSPFAATRPPLKRRRVRAAIAAVVILAVGVMLRAFIRRDRKRP
jgi:hypothetical protein